MTPESLNGVVDRPRAATSVVENDAVAGEISTGLARDFNTLGYVATSIVIMKLIDPNVCRCIECLRRLSLRSAQLYIRSTGRETKSKNCWYD